VISATRRGSARALLLAAVCILAVVRAAPAAAAASASEGLARRLCDALQALPAERKAECCGGSASGADLAEECTRDLATSLRDRAIALDAADVERCERESAQRLAGCDWVTPLMPETPPACRGVLHGRREIGGPCRSSLECADGLSCRGSEPTRAGICVPPAPPGATCSDAPDTLETYARQAPDDPRHPQCAGSCRKGRCAAPVAIGGACSASRQCAPGSHCAAGACVAGAPPKLGQPCAQSTCEGDLVCIDGRCAPRRKAGEPCSKPFECEAACLASPTGGAGACGMRCSSWPPAGYTPPRAEASSMSQTRAAAPRTSDPGRAP
jgi:hypothetical protein